MIYYRPTDGDAHTAPLRFRPRTCFLMTQLGQPVPAEVTEIRAALAQALDVEGYGLIDADSVITGRDFLLKIWEIMIAVPLGIAIIHQDMRRGALTNVFYELGMMQAYGKETLVVKTRRVRVPSDLVRTEYIEYGSDFPARIHRYLSSLSDRAKYYADVAEQLEKNPLMAIDHLRRAYLLTGSARLHERAKEIFEGAGLKSRAKTSVEKRLIDFGPSLPPV